MKKMNFIKKFACTALAATIVLQGTGNYFVPQNVVVKAAESVQNIVATKEAIVNEEFDITQNIKNPNNMVVEEWMLYHAGDTAPLELNGTIYKRGITKFTPTRPGFVWFRAKIQGKDNSESQYIKVTVKESVGAEAPTEEDYYTEEQKKAFKESLPKLKNPIQFGYFRTWHDYWSWMPDNSPNSLSDVPKEVDIVSVFHDGTEDNNPYWEKLREEYVPKLNRQGTRVTRTIGIEPIVGKWGPLKGKVGTTQDDYDEYARILVDEFVTKHGLDGLDIDFENHHTGHYNSNPNRVLGIFKGLAKLIGPNGADPSKLLILDTDRFDANHVIFQEHLKDFNYLVRQDYRNDQQRAYNAFVTSGCVAPEKYLSGFSFHEENSYQYDWARMIPDESLVADRDTNEPIIQNADELIKMQAFKNSNCYKYATFIGEKKLGGIFSYAIDRDGIALGNQKKFFQYPTKYFYSQALKKVMQYYALVPVTEITLTETKVMQGKPLELKAEIKPDNATHTNIVWSVVEGDNTTVKTDKIHLQANTLTVDEPGTVELKAMIENGERGEEPNFAPFEKKIVITIEKTPDKPNAGGSDINYIPDFFPNGNYDDSTKKEEIKKEEPKKEEPKEELKKEEPKEELKKEEPKEELKKEESKKEEPKKEELKREEPKKEPKKNNVVIKINKNKANVKLSADKLSDSEGDKIIIKTKVGNVILPKSTVNKLAKTGKDITIKFFKKNKHYHVTVTDRRGNNVKVSNITIAVKAKKNQNIYMVTKNAKPKKLKSTYKNGKLIVTFKRIVKFIVK